MVAMTVMTTLCAAGVGFYLRVLVALYKESKPRWIGYWMRLRLGPDEHPVYAITKVQEPETFITGRAA